MSTDEKICMARYHERGETHVCHEDAGHLGDHVCKTRSCGERWEPAFRSRGDDLSFVATAGGDPDESAVLLLPEHLADVAAFVRSQRAVGWREAIEALRDELGYNAWAICRKHVDAWQPTAVSDTHREIMAAFLESLAPKETP